MDDYDKSTALSQIAEALPSINDTDKAEKLLNSIVSRVAKLDESSYKSSTSNLAEIALKCKFGDDKITIIIDMITNVDS
jgi:hypothetical protein